MDSLTRSAVTRARAALDMAAAAPTPDPLPLSILVERAMNELQTELPYALRSLPTGDRGGVLVPWKRDVTTSTATGTSKGGLWVGSPRGPLIEELGVQPAVLRAGCSTLSMPANGGLPAFDTAAAVTWVGENVAPSQAAPTFTIRNTTAKTITAWIDVSRRLRLQASTDIDAALTSHLGRAVSRAIDAAAVGVGASNQPTGVLGTSGIGSVSLGTSGVLTRTKIIDAIKTVAEDGGLSAGSSAAFIISVDVAAYCLRTETSSGSGIYLFQPTGPTTGTLAGYPAFITDSMPAGSLLFGDFTKLYLVTFGRGVEFLVNPYVGGSRGAVRLSVFADVDVVIGQPEAFCKIDNIVTT